MSVAVLFAGQGAAAAVARALTAVAAAIDVAEADGVAVETVIVDATADAAVAAFLDGVDGALKLVAAPGTARAACWAQALAHTTAEHAWLVGSDSAPAPGALAALVSARAGAGADMAVPYPEPGAHALVARDRLEAGLAAGAGLPLGKLLAALADADGTAVGVAAAGTAPEPPEPRRRLEGARIEVVHPDAVCVGRLSYTGPGAVLKTWSPLERITIGAYCSIAEEVAILHPGGGPYVDAAGAVVRDRVARGGHRPDLASTFPMGLGVPDAPYFDPVLESGLMSPGLEIGNDVWIGYRSTVVGPVAIGDGAVVATGSVVLRDVAPYAIVAGNPAAVVRSRFSSGTVERLRRIAWWDWPPELVRGSWWWFTQPIARFTAQFDPAQELAATGRLA